MNSLDLQTYNTDQIVADSAGTATAFMCGEKAAAGVIGANQNTVYDNCSSQKGNEIQSVLHTAIQKGGFGQFQIIAMDKFKNVCIPNAEAN